MKDSNDASESLVTYPSDSDIGKDEIFNEWLTTEQAAKYLGLSVPSLRNMSSNGKIPFYKLGKRNRYRLIELRELLLSERRGSYGY